MGDNSLLICKDELVYLSSRGKSCKKYVKSYYLDLVSLLIIETEGLYFGYCSLIPCSHDQLLTVFYFGHLYAALLSLDTGVLSPPLGIALVSFLGGNTSDS